MATPIRQRFINVIVCEDVRDEVGNKKSLMGVFSGDVIAAEFPANLQIAFYLDYLQDTLSAGDKIRVELEVNGSTIMGAEIVLNASQEVSSIIIPRAIIGFETEGTFVLNVSVNDGKRLEVLRKKVKAGAVQPR